ncbi:MAG: NAD-dependent epimerase/dehydratase family protein [Deltaproteobacteria bacterium]|nr:NAD-dependent epimerase/dehydratase family protein [Kofleriaceae bacterium]
MSALARQVARARAAAKSGALGPIVSVELQLESAYPPYEGGPLPPHYRDAGHPFRELGAPCLAFVQELLGDIEDVEASWRSAGGDPNLAYDEWRAKVRCQRGVGEVRLSWRAKPAPPRIVLHGANGARRFPGRADRLLDAVARKDAAPPGSGAEAAGVTAWVDKIARAAEAEHRARLASFERSAAVPFLVTGASGSLGGAVVRALVASGTRVRALVRRIPEKPIAGVEYAIGNLGDPEAVDRAVKGAETVIHAGAAVKGGWSEHLGGTVIGTQNVIDACKASGVKQLVHISSMSVIDWAGTAARPGATVDETAALEPRPEERGPYTRAKLEAEKRVVAAAAAGVPCVILRPGQIFGGGSPLVNGAVARRVRGRWLVLGDGTLELPLVYLDDVVDAILAAVAKRLTGGQIIQLVDGELLTQQDVLALAGGGGAVVAVPRALVFGLGKLSELPLAAVGRKSPVALYRLRSALARLRWGTGKAEELLGWRPRVGVREGIRRVMGER